MSTHVLTFDHAEGELPICSKCRAPIDAAARLSDAVCPGEPQGCRPPFAHVFYGKTRCQCGAEGWDAEPCACGSATCPVPAWAERRDSAPEGT